MNILQFPSLLQGGRSCPAQRRHHLLEYCLHRKAGVFWFRILGYGLLISSYRKSPPLFSEREGYRNPFMYSCSWRAFFLRPN